MVTFDGLYPDTIVYLKVAGNKEVVSLPLSEALANLKNVVYDDDRSAELSQKEGKQCFSFVGDKETKEGVDKQKRFDVTDEELKTRLQIDIYENQYKIAAVAIQPEGKTLTPAVQQFLEI